VHRALETSQGEAMPSIHLGGLAVLAGSDAGLAHLKQTLPKVKLGSNQYPLQLEQHGPYHTRLVRRVSELAFERLASIEFRTPDLTLIDGRGVVHTPGRVICRRCAPTHLERRYTSPTTSVCLSRLLYASWRRTSCGAPDRVTPWVEP